MEALLARMEATEWSLWQISIFKIFFFKHWKDKKSRYMTLPLLVSPVNPPLYNWTKPVASLSDRLHHFSIQAGWIII